MKPTLQTRLGQQLSLTPQLRQAIRLLQLSTLELEAELTAAVESNPLLEREEDAVPGDPAEAAEAASGDSDSPGDSAPEAAADAGDGAAPDGEEPDWYESSLGGYERRGNGGEEPEEMTAAEPVDLHDHLLWQLQLSHLSPRDVAIGQALVEAISDDGYLACPLEDIQAALQPEVLAEPGLEGRFHALRSGGRTRGYSRKASPR